jgi:hypothetical protein
LGEPLKIILAFVVNRVASLDAQKRFGDSSLYLGGDLTDPLANTSPVANIYDGGFFDMDATTGQYFTVRREGQSSVLLDHIFNLNAIRLYQTPNLVESALILSEYALSGLEVGPEHLLTNLNSRSQSTV